MKFARYLIALSFFLSFALSAQQQSASLTGQISDSSGAAIAGASVIVSDPDRGSKVVATSNEHGDYTIPQLPPGEHYVITVSKVGFQETVQRDVVLQIAQSAKIDFKVKVGDVTQMVEVSTAPPQLDTQTSSLGQVITGATVENLPLNGRSSFRLIALTPGVTFSKSAYGQFGDVTVNSTFDTNFTINGGRSQSNEILIDGVPSSAGFFDQITTLPSVDDTQEFKVESNNLSAAYGRYAGGAINVTTKSGANTYHGNVFEFFRNSALDANDWFTKAAGKPIPPFKMSQYGGTIGGPVSIPHLYSGKDRTFFFFSYQGTHRIKGTTFIGSVPTAGQRTGDFSGLCTAFDVNGVCQAGKGTQLYNPFTTNATTKVRTAFANNMIPANLIDPVAAKMAAYYPLPNTGAAGAITNNFLSNAPIRVSQNTYSGRVDQNVTSKYHLFGRYAYSNSPLTQPNTFGNIADPTGAVGTTNFKNQSFAFDNLYQLSSSMLLTVDYGFARWYQRRQTLSYGFDNSTLGFPAPLVSAITIPMFPAVAIGGYTGLANQSFLNNGNDSHALLVSVTKIAGRHNLVAGVDGRIHRINFFNVANSGGVYNFAVAQTQGPVATAATGGNGFASFLIGAGSGGSIPIGSGSAIQSLYGAVYAQDNIRVSQRLTVNLGIRYDGETPNVERHDAMNYFDTTVASPAANASFPQLLGGLSFAGKTGNGRSVYSRDHTNVVPRIGFSYNPQASTVVRGGFGMSYAQLELSNNAVGFTPTLGYSSSTAWNTSNDGGLTPANLLRNPYPQGLVQPTSNTLGAGTQLGQGLTVWNHAPKTPLSLQWNLDVQQQFTPSLLFDLGYAASRGEHLTSTFERNQLDPKYLSLGSTLTDQVANPFKPFVTIGTLANATVARRQLLLPYPQFLSVTEMNNPFGSSTYHSLQTKLVKRASHGVTLLVSYTWSKLISNVNAQNAPIGATDNTTPQNYYDLSAERSVSELDQPHNLVISGVYELPFGHNRQFLTTLNPVVEKIIGGWKLTSILSEQSGFPLEFTAAPTGGGNRPNLVPGVDPVINVSRSNQDRVKAWFNTTAFATPPSYTYGTLRRTFTTVRGPGLQNVDASLVKDTRFFERIDTEFRAEFFNVSNTPHFASPNTARANANFGTVTAVLASPPPREIQFALKIAF
jgi:hypothetical protein